MNIINISFLENIYPGIKEKRLSGKWITLQNIEPIINSINKIIYSKTSKGTSEENRNIYTIKFGTGKKRILLWTQMHGNESTGTKALFDFFNFLEKFKDHKISQSILKNCTIIAIPMLNPDGALAYTRVNAKNIDLNRDAVNQKACESKLLRNVLNEFQPKFCFNLHDQRTIFGVEGTKNPATISFLAPSEEKNRTITEGRKQTMNVIISMNLLLQQIIPNQIGRYTDEFYSTATGDNFQELGYNTVLIEAGHYPNDYTREKTRKFNFYALLQGIFHISNTNSFTEFEAYFDIPDSNKNFFDIIHRYEEKDDVAFLYEEKIVNNQLITQLKKCKKGNLNNYTGHCEIFFKR